MGYFVILLVAFSGLFFPPMSFAQSNHNCPSTIQVDGATYSLDHGYFGGPNENNKEAMTQCYYINLEGPETSFGVPTQRLNIVITDIATTDPPHSLSILYDVPSICTDNTIERGGNSFYFTASKANSLVAIKGSTDTRVTSSIAQPFFNISGHAVPCNNQPKQSSQETITTESPVTQQSECKQTPNGVSAKIANAVWGEPEIKIVGVFKDVQVLRDGKSLKATRGMTIHHCDVIKTGDDGRVRIEFREPYTQWARNAGPSVLNLSPNSAIKIGEYGIFHKEGEANQMGLVEFAYGTFRAFAKNWGKNSIFSVKAGVALCGIRGSDMVFSYDPQQEKLSVFANEGEVSVKSETAGNTKLVTAGQSVIVQKGHINPVTAMSDLAWQSAVSKTVLPETQQASAQELGETQLSEPMEETSPLQDSGGGCLIATATYGSELAPQVQQLRELRDSKLLQTESGSNFIESFNSFYYSFSPYIADYERENPVFKEAVKLFITPMIASLSILNHVNMDSEAEILGYGISLIILNLGMYVGIPAFAIISIRKRL